MSNCLFYAYSRRTDNYWASRYLLTFQNAEVAKEWWDLVQKEYPDQGIRNGPQLFSFNGDNFPSKPATNKKFDHLKTKWIYSQMGDATGTGGRTQEVIPLQDYDGKGLGEGGRGGIGSGSGSGSGQLNMDKVSESLEQIQKLMSQNAAQIQTLAENQTASQSHLGALQEIFQENSKQINKVLEARTSSQNDGKEEEQKAAHSKEEADRQAALIQQMQSTLDQNAAQIKKLTDTLGDFAANFRDMSSVSQKAATSNEKSANCTHNVRPPPRKIEKKILGYDYGSTPSSKAPLTPSRNHGMTDKRLVNGIDKASVKKKDTSNGVANGSVNKKPSKVH
ncbi:MAG: hypothetical protein Q9167_005264 [Letrouitia subvulpina]